MIKEWRRRRALQRVEPGDGRALIRFRWWQLPSVVTRTIEPAAFLADPRVPYITAERLTAVLADPDGPEPGWIPATEPAS